VADGDTTKKDYLVHFPTLLQLAREYGLHMVRGWDQGRVLPRACAQSRCLRDVWRHCRFRLPIFLISSRSTAGCASSGLAFLLQT
jgi:hypothetical protein